MVFMAIKRLKRAKIAILPAHHVLDRNQICALVVLKVLSILIKDHYAHNLALMDTLQLMEA